MKFRVGFGKTGNASIGSYNSLSLIRVEFDNNDSYVYNGVQVPIAYPNHVPNPDLTWEKTSAWNYGLDMGFFNDRLSLTANYYYKKTTDMLLYVSIPQQIGFGSVLKNSGSMLNKGVELAIYSQNVQNTNFKWSTNFNISSNHNEVVSLGPGVEYDYTGYAGGGNVGSHGKKITRLQPGHPVGNFYGSIYEGIWNSQEEIDDAGTMPTAIPGDMRYKDTNGDGIYNTDDDIFLGNANPDFYYGLTNDFSFKRFNLHVFLYGTYGNEVLNIPAQRLIYYGYGTSAKRLQRWTPETPNNPYPAASSDKMYVVSSAIVEDGSFLRVQNVTLSYDIPVSKWGAGRFLRSAQIGVAADNLAIFTNYSGYDPEVNTYGNNNATKGVDMYGYPASRTFRINVKLGF